METISNIKYLVLVDVKERQSRTKKFVFLVVFMDGLVYKIRKDGII